MLLNKINKQIINKIVNKIIDKNKYNENYMVHKNHKKIIQYKYNNTF